MHLPQPIVAGYLPKRTAPKPDFIANPVVREICSVSECISPSPLAWRAPWERNAFGFYDNEGAALAIIGEERNVHQMFAYAIYPLLFDRGRWEPFPVSLKLQPLPGDYRPLGIDVVSRSTSTFFECSPLSCNRAADEFQVNESCLFDELDYAFQACVRISAGNYEPGPYHLVQVFRKSFVA